MAWGSTPPPPLPNGVINLRPDRPHNFTFPGSKIHCGFVWTGPKDQNNFSCQSSATGLAKAEPGTSLLGARKYPPSLIYPLRSGRVFSYTTKATFSLCLFKLSFLGVYFFTSFVLIRFLWALRKLEWFFILTFVLEMKNIHCVLTPSLRRRIRVIMMPVVNMWC